MRQGRNRFGLWVSGGPSVEWSQPCSPSVAPLLLVSSNYARVSRLTRGRWKLFPTAVPEPAFTPGGAGMAPALMGRLEVPSVQIRFKRHGKGPVMEQQGTSTPTGATAADPSGANAQNLGQARQKKQDGCCPPE